jgi:hypothetical protein
MPGTALFVQNGEEWISEVYDDAMMMWVPGSTVLRPGQPALLSNAGAIIETELVGLSLQSLPPVIPRNRETLVGISVMGYAHFVDLTGHEPENGTTLTRYSPFLQTHTFVDGQWLPYEPVLGIGEAAFVTIPCLVVEPQTNVTLEASSPMGALLTDVVAATNYCAEPVMVQTTPPLGTWLPLGTHPVQYQVFAGTNQVTGQTLVTVADTTPPEISGATNRFVEASGPAGTVVLHYGLVITDNADPAPQVTLTPPPGSLLPPGENVVECLAVDASGNTNSVEFTITVQDSFAPQIFCPPNLTLLRNTPAGADLAYSVGFSDAGDTNLVVEYSHPDGSMLPLGTTTVTCSVMDESGNLSTCSFSVQVIAPEPARVTDLHAAAGNVHFTFPSQAGVEYIVEYKNSLNDPLWQPLALVIGDGNPMAVVDPAPNDTQRFYRVSAPRGWDIDGDGKDDIVGTKDGPGYDTGSEFVTLPAKGWVIVGVPGGFNVYLDTDGDGKIDQAYERRDKDGDGDFGSAGEVRQVPVPPWA